MEKKIEGLEIRYTEVDDGPYLHKWLSDPEVYDWFPMMDEIERKDAVIRWVGFYRYKCTLTAVYKGVPCGIATLYLQPYKRIAHQCEFGIIVGPGFRDKGIGTVLMEHLINLAKNTFHIELLHLQVYAENPAINFYTRFGFTEFGRQSHWIKDEGRYIGRVFMEKFI